MLRNSFSRFLVGTITVVGMAACGSKSGHTTANGFDAKSIAADPSMSPEAKADELSHGAERLMSPTSFRYASEVADQALKQDPKNARARFIKAVLAPSMEMKGILGRIRPFVAAHPKAQAGYYQLVAQVKAQPERAYAAFLMNGPADIRTEGDVQELIARITLRLDDLRRTLNDLKGEEITLYVNDRAVKSRTLTEAAQKCAIHKTADASYDWSRCDFSGAYERTLNRADFEILKQQVAAAQVYLTVVNGWDLSGIVSSAERMESAPSREGIYQVLAQNPKLGHLRTNNGFGVIPDVVQDAVIGARFALAMQSSLCPTGDTAAKNRPGYLYENGLCAQNDGKVEESLALIESLVTGTPAVIAIGSTKATVNPMQFFKTPVEDLRSLGQVSFDHCGHALSVGDNSLGGVFPEHELGRVLTSNSNCQ